MSRILAAPFTAIAHGVKTNGMSTRANEVLTAIDNTKTRVFSIALIIVLGVTYLWLVNSSATAGFQLSDLEARHAALDTEYKKLELEQTALRSLDHIEEQSAAMNMVATQQAEYLKRDSAVALGAQ